MTVNVRQTEGTNDMRLPQWRVTVNSRCKRSCYYCRPSGEAVATESGTNLDPDRLLAVAAAVRAQGVDSVKLTGGDPALYEPLVDVVRRLREEAGMRDVEVISRHPRIGELAPALAEAGVTQQMLVAFPHTVVRVRRGGERALALAQSVGALVGIPADQMRFAEMWGNDHPDAPAAAFAEAERS
ncbi:radical SAM protein [Streptomyces sp. NPDC056632]|uniref:radical SAM protein n=1 Tax=Streptomyces sp. NPDC056632 TaxID=3345884 RepID=UPI0036A1D173